MSQFAKRISSIAPLRLFFCLLIVFASMFVPSVSNAQPNNNECTQGSLNGAYGYFFTGSAVGMEPVSAVGLATFDGEGGVSVKDSVNRNGGTIRRIGTGSYSVNSNCTGSIAVTGDFGMFSFDFTTIPRSFAKEFSLIVTNPGAIQTGEALYVGEEECALTTLQGAYRQSGSTPPGPRMASVGYRIADGAGTYYGEDTQSVNGVIGHRIVVATYIINTDCTGSATFDTGANFDSVIVAGGSQAFFLRVDPGFISLGTLKREERDTEGKTSWGQ